jgi:hypothetical protein
MNIPNLHHGQNAAVLLSRTYVFAVSEQNQRTFLQALPKLKIDEAFECPVRGSL